MKFIHIADVHIGAKPDQNYPWSEYREQEIIQSMYDIINVCNEEKIDLLLIAGDLFHRQPLLRELKELNYQFSKLKYTKVIIIAGNHDFIGPKSNYSKFEWVNQVTMFVNDCMSKHYVEELNTEVYGFSYCERNIYEHKLQGIAPEDNDRIHILIAHAGDDNNIPIDPDIVQQLPYDYIALGHIHKPTIFSNNCAYPGSLEPLDKTELGDHGYLKGSLDKEHCEIQLVPFSKRRYEWIEIEVSKDMTQGFLTDYLAKQVRQRGEQNIYRIRLIGYKDPDIELNIEAMKSIGWIIEIVDDTVPDYDFYQLREENKDNMIGLYIDTIQKSEVEGELKEKALYYGLEALLNAKE